MLSQCTATNVPPEFVKAREPELQRNPPPDGPLRRVTKQQSMSSKSQTYANDQSYLDGIRSIVAAG